jgi:DNA invertase Pin-like site-specific DNA recombinase
MKSSNGNQSAFLYARNATSKQNLANQIVRLREFANQNDITIAEEFLEVGSGCGISLPKMDAMLLQAQQVRPAFVLVTSFDRFSRNMMHYLNIESQLTAIGTTVVSLQMGMPDGTPESKLIKAICIASPCHLL